jgi:hypothetical protein
MPRTRTAIGNKRRIKDPAVSVRVLTCDESTLCVLSDCALGKNFKMSLTKSEVKVEFRYRRFEVSSAPVGEIGLLNSQKRWHIATLRSRYGMDCGVAAAPTTIAWLIEYGNIGTD